MTETFTLSLAKEDFKFSSAHFTLFAADEAERLHGHNYQVRLELAGSRLDGLGLLTDVAAVKRAIRALCERLDSRTLIPAESPLLELEQTAAEVTVRFRDRSYRFPAGDVVVLPLVNTSIELLARYLWQELAPGLAGTRVETLGVMVAETAGQGCWYRAPVRPG